MQSASRVIIAIGIGLCILSMVYFLSLVVRLPFFASVVIAVASIGLFAGWVYKYRSNGASLTFGRSVIALLLLATGIGAILWQSYPLAQKHGDWDAWAFWNRHALYLVDPLHWKAMFANTVADHPDYPLLVPAANAFFMRLAGSGSYLLVPYVFSISIMLFVPVLIFAELVTRNMVVASVVVLLFALNTFYIISGSAQYADVPLAFFFLCAVVCINHAGESGHNVALTAAALGCCMWTKNEGAILSGIFILWHAPILFAKRYRSYFAAAIVIPLLVLAVFKVGFAPANSMIGGMGKDTFGQVFMGDRYMLIYRHFIQVLNDKFWYVKIMFLCYIVLCIIERKRPGRQMLMLLTCMAAYTMVYVLSVEYLEWHLATSIDRLMLQLMPAMVYVIGLRFAGSRLLSFGKQDVF